MQNSFKFMENWNFEYNEKKNFFLNQFNNAHICKEKTKMYEYMSTFQLTDHILPQLMIKHFFEDEIYKFPAI